MTPYGIVIAFQLTPKDGRTFDPEQFCERFPKMLRDLYGGEDGIAEITGLDVAIREITPGTGKLTSGQWGANEI